jgi:hypothetical protein
MDTVTLGQAGPEVSRAGLGLMGMSGIYGPADRAESIATIRAALDAGITRPGGRVAQPRSLESSRSRSCAPSIGVARGR